MQVKNRITGASFRRICLLMSLALAGFPSGAQVQEKYLEGIALADRAAYREARAHFEEVLSYDVKNPECLLRLAEVCLQTGDQKAALDYLRQLETVDPGRGSYLLARGSRQAARGTSPLTLQAAIRCHPARSLFFRYRGQSPLEKTLDDGMVHGG
jgi:tetratricopeptide (TPR) repeat protein